MYHVIQVAPREEQKTVELIRNTISKELCRSCFFPMRHIRRKICGEFTDIREKLIPGYVFIETEHPHALYEEIKRIPRLTKILGTVFDEDADSFEFAELSSNEILWLSQIMSENDDTVHLSKVSVDEEGIVQILSGPLKVLENQVIKFDLHKRIAKVRVEFQPKTTVLHLGIEIVR